MRTCSIDTIRQIKALDQKALSSSCLNPAAITAVWDALHGRPMSRKREEKLRWALGIPPLPSVVEVASCPSCAARGIVISHGDKLDCNGNGGTAVVLASGETVRRPTRRKRSAVRRPWMGTELSAAMDMAGVTDEDVRRLVAATLAGSVQEVLP